LRIVGQPPERDMTPDKLTFQKIAETDPGGILEWQE
jgi:hypothetical protein